MDEYVPSDTKQLNLLSWVNPAPSAEYVSDHTSGSSVATSGTITDFGEKIAGARKDLWKEYHRSITSDLPENAAEITLSRYFPEPNYELLIKNGIEIGVLAAVKTFRDSIPTKPKTAYKLPRWVSAVRSFRNFARDLIDGNISLADLKAKLTADPGLKKIADRITLYEHLDYPAFTRARGWSIYAAAYSVYKGERFDPAKTMYTVEHDHRLIEAFETYDEAFTLLAKNLAAPAEEPSRETRLDIYKMTRTGDIVIGKKVAAGKYIDLKTGFSDWRAAKQYLAEHKIELLDLLDQKKDVRPERRSVNDPRVGPDYRKGQHITPEAFLANFGLRGVQFGNYVEQARRTTDLNNAHDAFTDLATVLGLQPSALSLGGSLGLAFGARGSGGKGAAAAHYEPGQIVINLTKTNGAGSLAHEWFHALDNHIARRATAPLNAYATANPAMISHMNLEIADRFAELAQALRTSPFYIRSAKLDETRSKDYWSTTIEMAARAFETFVLAKLSDHQTSNDYLVNIIDEDLHAATNAATGSEQPYAYPTADERPKLNIAFERLFSTLKAANIL